MVDEIGVVNGVIMSLCRLLLIRYYGVKIFVITSFKDTCYIEILPHVPKSARIIFLSFWAEVHYNSIYPEGGKNAFVDCMYYEFKILLNFIFPSAALLLMVPFSNG
ncbi:hypothetical protein Patl1_06056 [Pistacia atlantica]|uniref:Uncharacterized protein n=1 Tax=Pistacia atlantica TaxID=434234 RepID=A0ACC1BNV2_9ROSI|nr:hypothetical protein Patl1_06056 [Pistacia atlantica]